MGGGEREGGEGQEAEEGQKNGDSRFESFVIEWFLLLVHYLAAMRRRDPD